MKLTLNNSPYDELTKSKGVSILYWKDILAFSKPNMIFSSAVDILCHEVSLQGYTFRNYVFYVKKPSSLTMNISSNKLCIMGAVRGSFNIELPQKTAITVNDQELVLLQLNTEDDTLNFTPGICEIVRCDYSPEKIYKYGTAYNQFEKWNKIQSNNEAALLEHKSLNNQLITYFSHLKSKEIKDTEAEMNYHDTMRKVLYNTLNIAEITQ